MRKESCFRSRRCHGNGCGGTRAGSPELEGGIGDNSVQGRQQHAQLSKASLKFKTC